MTFLRMRFHGGRVDEEVGLNNLHDLQSNVTHRRKLPTSTNLQYRFDRGIFMNIGSIDLYGDLDFMLFLSPYSPFIPRSTLDSTAPI